MPGMNSGLNANNSVLVAAFREGLHALPAWTATVALGPGGQVDAIAAHASTFTDWRLAPAGWNQQQTIRVTIPYGSSG